MIHQAAIVELCQPWKTNQRSPFCPCNTEYHCPWNNTKTSQQVSSFELKISLFLFWTCTCKHTHTTLSYTQILYHYPPSNHHRHTHKISVWHTHTQTPSLSLPLPPPLSLWYTQTHKSSVRLSIRQGGLNSIFPSKWALALSKQPAPYHGATCWQRTTNRRCGQCWKKQKIGIQTGGVVVVRVEAGMEEAWIMGVQVVGVMVMVVVAISFLRMQKCLGTFFQCSS